MCSNDCDCNDKKDLRINSIDISEGVNRTPNRAMLRAVGFKDEDFKKPMVGVASTWSEVTPCNIHIDQLALKAKKGVKEAGGAPLIFNTITVSDGIAMGHEGMRYSLPSREVIADSIETVVGAQRLDGVVAIGGCDKNMPGCMIAIGRLNLPSVFVYGGTIQPGKRNGEDIDISYKTLKKGYQNYYYPKTQIIHYKGESTKKNAKYLGNFYGAMRIFYNKHFRLNKLYDSIMGLGISFWYWFRFRLTQSKRHQHQ